MKTALEYKGSINKIIKITPDEVVQRFKLNII